MAGDGRSGAGWTAAERRADRLASIRLRFSINSHLDERGVTDPAAIGAALALPADEAVSLLRRSRWREGDVAALRRAAERLGLSETPSGHWVGAPRGEDGHGRSGPQST